MINLTPRKASRNSVSSFPSPDSLPQEQQTIETIATPINPSSIHQESSAFITPTTSSFNNDISTSIQSQLMSMNNASNLHHQYTFKPSATSSYLKPFMSYFFAHRKNIHDNPTKKGESIWPERIVFIIGTIIFFTLSSVILINVLNFLFRQKTLPKSSAKDVIYFLIGEVCTTLLLVLIRLFFNLENSDYDHSITKHRYKISQHGAEVGVLFEYFTLDEREILFYLSNISIYLVGYATNSLCYAILFELIIVQAGSKYGFFKKDLLGLCVVLANIFSVFLGWFNVRVNDSLEVFLVSCSVTLMMLMYSTSSSSKMKQLSIRNDFPIPEESVFILPKLFRLAHIIFLHLKADAKKDSYIEMFLVMFIGILGSIIIFRAYNAYMNTMKQPPKYIHLGRPLRNRNPYAQQRQYFNPAFTPQQQQLPQGYYPQQAQPFGTPQQNPYNPYQSQYSQMPQAQPAFTHPQQFTFSTPQSEQKLFYSQPPSNTRINFTPQQRY